MLREPSKTPQTTEQRKEADKKEPRFRIVKLEERIAPNKGGHPDTGIKTYGCHNYTR